MGQVCKLGTQSISVNFTVHDRAHGVVKSILNQYNRFVLCDNQENKTVMKIPTIEQLQAWTAQWDQAKPHLSYLKVLDQRLQQASDTEEIRQVVDDLVNPVRQDELGQDPTGVELINDGVDQDESQDQQAKKIKNTQRAKVFKMIADEHISPLYKELGSAFEFRYQH